MYARNLPSGDQRGLLGLVLALAGLCYVVQDFGTILWPGYQDAFAVVGAGARLGGNAL